MEESSVCCLFCWEKIFRYIVPCNKNVKGKDKLEISSVPNFQGLCKLLNITGATDELQQLINISTFFTANKNVGTVDQSCENFLCLCCFEMVQSLTKLHFEADEIHRKIKATTSKIREIIISTSPNSLTVPAVARFLKRTRQKDGKSKGLEFFLAFQNLVKKSEIFAGSLSTVDECSPSENVHNLKGTECIRQSEEKQAGEGDRERSPSLLTVSNSVDHHRGEHLRESLETDAVKVETNQDCDDDDDDPWEETNGFDILDSDDDSETSDVDTEKEKIASSVKNKVGKGSRKRKKNNDDDDPLYEPSIPVKAVSRDMTSCRYCGASFPTQALCFKHQKTCNENPRVLPPEVITTFETKNNQRIVIRVCPVCGLKVKGSATHRFMEHMISHENTAELSAPLYSCDMCDLQFSLKLNLDLHKIRHHRRTQKMLNCELCGDFTSQTRDELVDHLKSHDSNLSIHCCKSCPKVCTSLEKLLSHMYKHLGSKRLFCSECDNFMATNVNELFDHCCQAHPELKLDKLDCDHCEKSFISTSALQTHVIQTHKIKKKGAVVSPAELVCSQCNNGKVFHRKASLNRHIKNLHGSNDSRPHKCNRCDQSFLFKHLLEMHVNLVHEKIRYPCPYCPKSYSEHKTLNEHLRIHTGQGLHTCEWCGKQFTRRYELNNHSEKVHLTNKDGVNLVCKVCKMEFPDRVALSEHRQIHIEKNWKCTYCDKTFHQKNTLLGHLRTHSGSKPFDCHVCSKCFGFQEGLIGHLQTVHGYSSRQDAWQACKERVERINEMIKSELPATLTETTKKARKSKKTKKRK